MTRFSELPEEWKKLITLLWRVDERSRLLLQANAAALDYRRERLEDAHAEVREYADATFPETA